MTGAIKMNWNDGSSSYILLPIHEFRSSGPVFAVPAGYTPPFNSGTHLLSAADVRGSWNGWVGELVRDDQIVDVAPDGVEIY